MLFPFHFRSKTGFSAAHECKKNSAPKVLGFFVVSPFEVRQGMAAP
jgi:hypothetical protein